MKYGTSATADLMVISAFKGKLGGPGESQDEIRNWHWHHLDVAVGSGLDGRQAEPDLLSHHCRTVLAQLIGHASAHSHRWRCGCGIDPAPVGPCRFRPQRR